MTTNFHSEQRRALGIPKQLDGLPVVYASTHDQTTYPDSRAAEHFNLLALNPDKLRSVISEIENAVRGTENIIGNFIYLPPLESNSGESLDGPSHTFGLFNDSCVAIGQEAKDFAAEKLNLSVAKIFATVTIAQNTSKTGFNIEVARQGTASNLWGESNSEWRARSAEIVKALVGQVAPKDVQTNALRCNNGRAVILTEPGSEAESFFLKLAQRQQAAPSI